MLLLLAAAGCAEDPAPPAAPAKANETARAYVPIFHVATSGDDLAGTLAARFAEASVDAKVVPVNELPPDEIPSWVDNRDEGFLVFVDPAQRDEAEAVRVAWLESMDMHAAKEKEPAAARPALVLGAAGPVAPEVVASVQAELERRVRLDQAVRRDPARHGEMPQVDADNTAWLTKVVVEHGWIDAARFGTKAADAAFLLVQHSGDLPLMNAALPVIEAEVRARHLNAQNFALLFDRLRIMQGGRQRYGTQVIQDSEKGDWVVGRLEDPDHVDERRREIGLGPLAAYLSGFGHEVRIER